MAKYRARETFHLPGGSVVEGQEVDDAAIVKGREHLFDLIEEPKAPAKKAAAKKAATVEDEA